MLKVANPGGLPQAVTQEVVFERNVVRDVSGGINLLGHDYTDFAGQLASIAIRDNRFTISKAAWGGSGWFLKIGGEPKEVVVEHNAIVHDGSSLVNAYLGTKKLADGTVVAGGPVRGFIFKGNAATAQGYGFFLNGAANAKGWHAYESSRAMRSRT